MFGHIKWIVLVFTYFLSFLSSNNAQTVFEEWANNYCNEKNYRYTGWPKTCAFEDNKTTDAEQLTPAEPAKPGEFPSYVHITFRYKSSDYYLSTCGGVLISDKVVLTAAHCLNEREGHGSPISIKIRAGFVNGGSLDKVEKAFAIRHCVPTFISNNTEHPRIIDQAALYLDEPFEIDEVNIQTACYDFNKYHVQGALCYAVGFLPNMTLNSRSQLYKIRVKRVPDNTPAGRSISCYKHGGLPSGVSSDLDTSCLIDGGSPIYCINYCNFQVQQYVFGVFSYGIGNETCDRMCFNDFYKIQTALNLHKKCVLGERAPY